MAALEVYEAEIARNCAQGTQAETLLHSHLTIRAAARFAAGLELVKPIGSGSFGDLALGTASTLGKHQCKTVCCKAEREIMTTHVFLNCKNMRFFSNGINHRGFAW